MFYWLTRAVLGPLVRLVYQPWITGAENIPAKGAAILASNHLAVFDSVFVPVLIPRRVFYIAKSDYFTGRGLKGRLIAGFMKGVGMIPVDRAGGRAAASALEQGERVLRKGHLFGIYPEGTRSPDGRLYRGKTGVARLALETGAPVVPIAMIGSNVAQPVGKRLPKKRVRVGIVVGEPIDLSRYRGLSSDRFVLREITDQIMFEIMKLSGQEYVDVYAATMKARFAAGAPSPDSETSAIAPGGRPRPTDLEPPEPPELPKEPEAPEAPAVPGPEEQPEPEESSQE
ncbi:MAG: 1-acyl-sn-glycerol-3-phosphate acyltransferase [Bifidobacteriaceae bacterium]|nr:1-acyl-sn-glycerol-3-phosphate acyltransferase [Bifidobacteriaceae bacterium]